MPKYYCDYCDTFLTHDSPSVRKTHNGGRKHKENVRMYYQNWMEQQAQKLVDATTKAFSHRPMIPGMPGMAAGIPLPNRPPMHPAMMRAPLPFPYAIPGAMQRPGMIPGAIPPLPPGAAPMPRIPMPTQLPRPV
ncbi:U1 small nuclear ribonucleoprotein C [Aphelenchoides besseyi]|nr:U1 small nuclear ribonucleoprotein C [Aphelenchoides besseyi]KAI6200512.1 U1 small nuclear ribonucleoprotein C [Aphelenchoides besseyi]